MLDGMVGSPGADNLVSGIAATVNGTDSVPFASEAGSGRETRARTSILDLCRERDKIMAAGRCLRQGGVVHAAYMSTFRTLPFMSGQPWVFLI